MKKSYSFEVLRQKIALVVSLFYILFVFALIIVLGVYTQQVELVLTLVFLLFFLPILFYKKLVPIRKETVTIEKNGFFLESQKRFIEWDSIIWQKTDSTTSPLIDTIGFGLSKGKNVRIPYYKKSKQQNNWDDFKREILRMTEENCPNIRDYYASKSWTVLIYALIASWLVIPFVLISLNLEVRRVMPMLMIYIASTIPLITAVTTRKRRK